MPRNTLATFVDPLMTGASMASSVNGTPTLIQFMDNVGYQFSWTGSDPLGTITIQVSADYDPRFPSAATWTTLQTSPGTNLTVTPGGSAGNAYVDLNQLSAPAVRPVYTTATSSSGALTAKLTAKGF